MSLFGDIDRVSEPEQNSSAEFSEEELEMQDYDGASEKIPGIGEGMRELVWSDVETDAFSALSEQAGESEVVPEREGEVSFEQRSATYAEGNRDINRRDFEAEKAIDVQHESREGRGVSSQVKYEGFCSGHSESYWRDYVAKAVLSGNTASRDYGLKNLKEAIKNGAK